MAAFQPLHVGLTMPTLVRSQIPPSEASSDRDYQSRPEIALLLACAQTQLEHQQIELLRQLAQQPINWAYVLKAAANHGLLPLLYQNLAATCADLVPPDTLNQLQNNFRKTSLRNLFLTQELLHLLEQFAVHQIPVIPYKGLVLAASVYHHLGRRQFADLDLLVPPNYENAAKCLLQSLRFELMDDLGWESSFRHPIKGVMIDLHKALMPRFFALQWQFADLESRLTPIQIAGASVPSFSPEDLLLFLCVQFGKDCCHWRVRLAQLCDVMETLRTYPELDWDWVQQEARRLRVERIVWLTLSLVQELWGVVLPLPIATKIQVDGRLLPLKSWVIEHLWNPPFQLTSGEENPGFWEFLSDYHHGFYLTMRDRWVDRLLYCWHWAGMCGQVCFTPNQGDYDLIALPQWLRVLYYPIHVGRLLVKHRPKFWR